MNEIDIKLVLPKFSTIKNSKNIKDNLFSPTQSSILNIGTDKYADNNIIFNINSSNDSLKSNRTTVQFKNDLNKNYINKKKKNLRTNINKKLKSPLKIKKNYQIGLNWNKNNNFCKCNLFQKINLKNCLICNKKVKNQPFKKNCNCNFEEYKGICCNKNIEELKKINISTINKNKVVQNIFFKNEKYYYSNKINFQEILKKIYYDNYKLEDLKEYILPSFKKIKAPQTFFELLFIEAKLFGDSVKNLLMKEIKKFNVINNNINNCFNYDNKKIIKIINWLYDYYKNLENINFEIEKLTKIYLENFLEKKKQFSFDTFLFHRKMFINRVYNESIIHEFILFIIKIFKNNYFNQNNYKTSWNKIYEIYETLEQISIEFSKNCPDKKNNEIKNEIINNINKKKKKKKKNKKLIKSNIKEISENNIVEIENDIDNDEDYLKLLKLIPTFNNNFKRIKILLNKEEKEFYYNFK